MLHGGQVRFFAVPRRLAALDACHRVELTAIPRRALERLDRSHVVEERRGIVVSLWRRTDSDIGFAVATVVDVDLVEHVVAELVEVRTGGRTL